MPEIISVHDVWEPLKQVFWASRDVIISSQIRGSNVQRFSTLGDGCCLPSKVDESRGNFQSCGKKSWKVVERSRGKSWKVVRRCANSLKSGKAGEVSAWKGAHGARPLGGIYHENDIETMRWNNSLGESHCS